MENNDFGTRVRENRSSGAVLKARVSNIRSRYRSAVIAVVEGVTDVGPYEVWTTRISHDHTVEFAPATGKSQILDFRRRIRNDQSGLAVGVYMFVDQDFDGLRGQSEGNDIFCTDAYSIENYLVSETVLRSILTDEFRCTAETDHRDNILKLFARILCEFNECIKDANGRIFRGRQLGLLRTGIDDKISKYVEISHYNVRKIYDKEKLADLIGLEREPSLDETACIDAAFEELNPLLSYRGKFLLAFFRIWLEKLSEEGRRAGHTLFPDSKKIHFSTANLTLRSLATRSSLPDGLEKFIRNMTSPPPFPAV